MNRVAIAIFVKTPGLSPLKTRLAADIGENNAISFYEHSLQIAEEAIVIAEQNSDFNFQPFWAVAEEQALHLDTWQSFARIYQGSGSLGERLSRIYSGLITKFRTVILIGADCPTISANVLLDAANQLCHHSDKKAFVLGPANDGGFYLFGGNKTIAESIWTSVTYSCDSTAAELTAQLTKHGEIHTLPTLSDVDTGEDLNFTLLQMKNNEALTLSQQIMLTRMLHLIPL
ncbi:MAG: glycosyltransferase [bacterium]|nr:glycosyltransferase [bacterium]